MHESLRSAPVRHARGFTLVELMITLGVLAILTVIAVPSFNNMINSNRLTTAANEIVAALNTARMEAIKRNGYTQFCSDSASNNTLNSSSDILATNCGTASGAVLVELTPASTATVFAPPPDLQMPIRLHGDINAIRFHGDGLGYAPGSTTPYNDTSTSAVADICTAALSSNNHIMIQMATGSIITTTTTTATCP